MAKRPHPAKPNAQLETKSQKASKMEDLARLGQSVWLDSIDRKLLASGELRQLVTRGLRGLTSNPSIFEKAIGESGDYDSKIRGLLCQGDLEVKNLFDELSIGEIREACDLLRPVYDGKLTPGGARDGLVSLELAPYLAHDVEGSVVEAHRLWYKVDRPNLMIKVPGTSEGLEAFKRLIGEGISVNITLLFSQKVYRSFAEAYLRALQARVARGLPIQSICSVASFFVSRIDSEVDKRLATPFQAPLRGRIAIANAKCAYQIYLELFRGSAWEELRAKGAQPQRLLWASTSTKNPQYSDVLYVEELIGPDTINTMPPSTLLAFEDHGTPEITLSEGVDEARDTLRQLQSVGISLDEVTDKLTRDGIRHFAEPYRKLMRTLETKRREYHRPNAMELRVPILPESEIGNQLQLWAEGDRVRRIWEGDATLWTGKDEGSWLGWLRIAEQELAQLDKFTQLQEELRNECFEDVVVLGMGGSSLCADLVSSLFDPADRFPVLHVLDSTDPLQIRSLQSKLDFKKTLFIVSSKSGTTLEPNLFLDYFYECATQELGDQAGSLFVAITDPGTPLERRARELRFRRVFHGEPEIGGRYSALSDFGLVPTAAMGLDVRSFLSQALVMAHSCSPNVPAEENPGLILGTVLGTLAKSGHDKITFICSPEIWELGDWLEQLLAESTGKNGTGLIPICGEKLGGPSVYGKDRVFIYLRLDGSIDRDSDARMTALEGAGFPVVKIDFCDCPSIAQELFRWEFAIAVAGSILGINPFDQPDVEAAKQEARNLTDEYEKSRKLPEPHPILTNKNLEFFADPTNAEILTKILKERRESPSLGGMLRAHLSRLKPSDYVALLAFLPSDPEIESDLEQIRLKIRDSRGVATTLGFGPRYLHSTGQLHKGGPDSGLFIYFTHRVPPKKDLAIPGKPYGFTVVESAQALGDFEVIARKRRRLLGVRLEDLSALREFRELL